MAPKRPHDGTEIATRRLPKGPKTASREPKRAHDAAELAHGGPKVAAGGHKSGQAGPVVAPRRPKRAFR